MGSRSVKSCKLPDGRRVIPGDTVSILIPPSPAQWLDSDTTGWLVSKPEPIIAISLKGRQPWIVTEHYHGPASRFVVTSGELGVTDDLALYARPGTS